MISYPNLFDYKNNQKYFCRINKQLRHFQRIFRYYDTFIHKIFGRTYMIDYDDVKLILFIISCQVHCSGFICFNFHGVEYIYIYLYTFSTDTHSYEQSKTTTNHSAAIHGKSQLRNPSCQFVIQRSF